MSAVSAEVIGGDERASPRPEPCVIVIFGATGDLTGRKLAPALYNLMLDDLLPEPCVIIGVAREPMTTATFADHVLRRVSEHSRREVDPARWERFAAKLDYVAGEFATAATYDALAERLAAADSRCGGNRLFYFATPPAVFPMLIENLAAHKLIERRPVDARPACRVIVEKPFGRDLGSATALNDLIAKHLDENQIFRIDHYLGKETVQNILVLRFGNSIFEPLWNRNHVDHVEITAAESIGIEGRGAFYESTGVIRDVVQNHLLQVLSLVAMEVPASFSADDIRDEKIQVLRSIRRLHVEDVAANAIRGQYRGYRDEAGVAKDSTTATYAALRVMIDDWRWQGVPFFLRAGKHLAERVTEVAIHFKSVPLVLFKHEAAGEVLQPAVLTLRIQPEEGISLRFVAKVPGDRIAIGNVVMSMAYADAFHRPISEAYERLLLDCMRGDATLYPRRDSVDRAWQLMDPILHAWDGAPGVPIYEPGSAGPVEADALIAVHGDTWRPLTKAP
ncbi:MAG: glucose-6-phosphate dehydrogenase [Kofleriaceae bacterium]